jgi:hypothetical protein
MPLSRLKIYLAVVFTLAFTTCSNATSIPFESVYLNPSQHFDASYSFGAHPVIFCYANNTLNNGVIIWPYHGKNNNLGIPIFLKVNGQYEGEFADPNGTITITNNTKSTLAFSCQYAF